ncbi:putative disease resistance protein At3g14460 [Citrus clementina]|uniref:putative disease resistance protein At3g14460 n=1 Tax=Citrus clementina TaxID=85681 RepID=UPI000CED36DA|nr:putative disease resistance protein At3g14460 [Citrus x clementina]
MGNLLKLHHLDNFDVYAWEEIPKGIGKLACLLTLCSFVVGKDIGSALQELKLLHLHGALEISKLENVRDASEAGEAQLNGKKNLKTLLLQWTSNNGDSREPAIETHVPDMLRPHQNLERFCISGYGGTKFRIWLEDSSFKNLVSLRCSKLLGTLPKHLPSLEKLVIQRCEKLLVDLPSLPSLSELKLGGCKKVVLPSQLKVISISLCKTLESLPELWMRRHQFILESLSIQCCNSLTNNARVQLPLSLKDLSIAFCDNLRTLVEEQGIPKGSRKYSSHLEYLHILSCPSLTSIFSENELPATLQRLEVNSCSKLALLTLSGNLPQGLKYLELTSCSKWESIADDNTSLQVIKVFRCKNLKTLPDGLHKLNNLQAFTICKNLVSFPKGGLPSTQLRDPDITSCQKLEALPNGDLSSTFKTGKSSKCGIFPREWLSHRSCFP